MKKTVLFLSALLTCIPSAPLSASYEDTCDEQYNNESDKPTEYKEYFLTATSFLAATGISSMVLAYAHKQNPDISLGSHICNIILSSLIAGTLNKTLPQPSRYKYSAKRDIGMLWGVVLPPLAYICSKALYA